MDELDFEGDTFKDIVSKDRRYAARAYTLLTDVLDRLGSRAERDRDADADLDDDAESPDGAHFSAQDIMEEFKERTLDLFGPLSFAVLSEWGVKRTEDLGEMMSNLVETRRIRPDEGDSIDDFAGGFDFEAEFIGPFAT